MSGARQLVQTGALGLGLMMISVALANQKTLAAQEGVLDQLTQAIQKAQTLRQQIVGYDAVFLRDPMRPLVDEQGERIAAGWLSGSLSVQGVIWSNEQPLAVVDGELLAPGAVVGSYTIQQIYPNGILVRRGETSLFIPLDRGLEPPQEHAMSTLEQQIPASRPAAQDAGSSQ